MVTSRSELKTRYEKNLLDRERSIQRLQKDLANAKTQFDQSIYREDLYRFESEVKLIKAFLSDLAALEVLD